MQKTRIGSDGSVLPDRLQSLCRSHSFLIHQISSHDGSRSGPPHDTIDHHGAPASCGLINEVGRSDEVSGDVCRWVVIDVESEVTDVVRRESGRVDRHVAFGCVQHVGHADAAKVVDVLDGFAIGQVDARIHL